MKLLKTGTFIFLLLGPFVYALGQTKTISIANMANIERKDELVVMKRSLLQHKLEGLSADKFVIVQHQLTPVVVQYDDLDGDGIWDEAVFLYSFKPLEKVVFSLQLSNHPATVKAVVKAHVRQKHKNADNGFGASVVADTMPYNNPPTDFSKVKLPPYLTEGPAWENDKVGFRKYFDTRNANDLWGKITNKMVMDQVGVNPDSIYHRLSWWGMDILKVGKSLGAGAIAIKLKLPNGMDTLVRMGVNTNQTTYKQIADGPVRAMFRMTYKGCNIAINIKPLTITETICIWGGQYFFQNEIQVDGASQEAKVVTGIPDFYQCPADTFTNNASAVLYAHGKQSENSDMLGMAVLVPQQNLVAFGKAENERSDVANTFLVELKSIMNQPIRYRFYSAWQLTDQRFADKKFFTAFLQQQSGLFAKPLVIR